MFVSKFISKTCHPSFFLSPPPPQLLPLSPSPSIPLSISVSELSPFHCNPTSKRPELFGGQNHLQNGFSLPLVLGTRIWPHSIW